MMPQMEGESYGAYRGEQRERPPRYEEPYHASASSNIDDHMTEAIAQRVVAHMSRMGRDKAFGGGSRDSLNSGQRTAVAIVSVAILVPIGIVLGQAGFGGLVGLGVICLAIFLINAVVNNAHR